MAKILIIEDELQLAEAYAYLFRKKGFKVSLASNGEAGLEMAIKTKPDVILLDMMMPVLDGLGFLSRYNTKSHPDVKIILLSNMQSQLYEKKAYELGIVRYEIKASLSPAQLIKMVEEIVSSKHSGKKSRSS